MRKPSDEMFGSKGYRQVKAARGSPIKPTMDNDTRTIGVITLGKGKNPPK